MLIDSGDDVSDMRYDITQPGIGLVVPSNFDDILAVNGSLLPIIDDVNAKVEFGDLIRKHILLLSKDVAYEVILGADFLNRVSITVDSLNLDMVILRKVPQLKIDYESVIDTDN